jgi:protease-4
MYGAQPPAGAPRPQFGPMPQYGPPMMMPPPMFYPPPPPPPQRERSIARALFTTLMTTIFGISLALNIYLLLITGVSSSATGGLREETVIEGAADQQVAVLPVHGLIDRRASEQFEKALATIEKDAAVKALVIDIDTPGGDVTASDEMYALIRRFKEKKNIPIVATMGALGTSGGYYVACAADYIFAQETTLTGNIGVLWPRYNVNQLAQKWGVQETTIASTGATYKNAGSMFQPEKTEDTQYLQGLVDSAFTRFKTVVSQGRNGKLKGTIDAIANGKAYTAREAFQLGLVDDVNYAFAAYDKAAGMAGLSKKHVVRYQKAPSLFGLGDAKFSASAANSGTVNINGVNVQLDGNALHELTTPRLMYLWRGQ